MAVLVGTGMRLDEALHLMWSDIDLQHRVIHVHRGRRGAPKSGRLRHVPIFDSVLTVLREMKLGKGKNTLLWPGAKLDKFDEQLPRNKTSVFGPFKAAVLRAGLPKKHDFGERMALLQTLEHERRELASTSPLRALGPAARCEANAAPLPAPSRVARRPMP